MFIKTSIFKRILKDAWKGAGLTVGKKEEMYFIQGAYWILFVYDVDQHIIICHFQKNK